MFTNDQKALSIQAGWKICDKPHQTTGNEYITKQSELGLSVVFEDRVQYKPDEMEKIGDIDNISINMHNVKKIFAGIII